MTESYPGTQAIVRALRLLKLFGGPRRAWELNDLVAATGLNKSTVFRMLTALESEGLLTRAENGQYQPGVELVALGGRALMNNSLRQVALPLLTQFVAEAQEHITLEQPVIDLDGRYAMLIVGDVQSKYLISTHYSVGNRHPIHATSTGKVVLAFMPLEKRAAILQQPLPALTPATLTDPARLENDLVEIRRRGYAVAVGELETGLMAAGVPIRDYRGEVIAAISIEGPATRIAEPRLHQLAQALLTVAEQISQRLGYR